MNTLEEVKAARERSDAFFTRMALGSKGPSMQPIGERGCELIAALNFIIPEYERLLEEKK